MCSTITTDDGTKGQPKLAKGGFKKFANYSDRRWWESAFASTHLTDRPKESGIKDLFGGEICTVMSPGGPEVAS
ncbi:hypothetical protein Tco_1031259 [Tanacetum coccineum]|uniref:Uncharacterized protein n=1 Tax=Tanacetum coccineum TaxID=301880 RepID=A0ABQ5G9L2_9ASTR